MTVMFGKLRTNTIIDADYCCQLAIMFSHTLEQLQPIAESAV